MGKVKIRFIHSFEMLGSTIRVTWDKNSGGGFFNWGESKMVIGLKNYKDDPMYTYSIISHEVMEMILVAMGGRYANGRTGENYLFNFDHQTFENAIQVHTQVMAKFLF